RFAVQHHWRLRRHFDGDERNELLTPIARPDCRLHRDGNGGPMVRRTHCPARLRQEYAGRADGDGPAQSTEFDDLRRHDQAGIYALRWWRAEARYRECVSVLR